MKMVIKHVGPVKGRELSADWTIEHGNVVSNLNDEESITELVNEISQNLVDQVNESKLF